MEQMERDDVQRVETEVEPDAAPKTGGAGAPGGFRTFSFSTGGPGAGKPPKLAAWGCLIAAWLFLGSSAPFTVFLGLPLALAAVVLGAVCLSRGGNFTGVAVLALGTVGSLAVYLVGLFRFLAG